MEALRRKGFSKGGKDYLFGVVELKKALEKTGMITKPGGWKEATAIPTRELGKDSTSPDLIKVAHPPPCLSGPSTLRYSNSRIQN